MFRYLAVVATGSLLLVDLGVILAVLRLRQLHGLPKDGEFRLPFGPVVPVLSFAFVAWLLLQMPLGEAATVAAMVGVCVAFYAIRTVLSRRSKSPRRIRGVRNTRRAKNESAQWDYRTERARFFHAIVAAFLPPLPRNAFFGTHTKTPSFTPVRGSRKCPSSQGDYSVRSA